MFTKSFIYFYLFASFTNSSIYLSFLFIHFPYLFTISYFDDKKSENPGPSIPDGNKEEVSLKTQKDLKRKLKQNVRTTPLSTDEEILRVPLSASKGLNGQQLKIQATYSRVPITDNTGSQGQGQGSAGLTGLTGLAGLGIAGFGGNGQGHGNGSSTGLYREGRNPASLPSTRGKYTRTYSYIRTYVRFHDYIHSHAHTHTLT